MDRGKRECIERWVVRLAPAVVGALLLLSSLYGCAGKRHTLPAPAPPETATAPLPALQMREEEPSPETEEPHFLDTLPPDVAQAVETYQRTGKAPVIDRHKDGFIIFPFGQSQPTVTCKPMRLCNIELERGERLSGDHSLVVADPTRWNATRIDEGEGESLRQHVMIKPNDDIPLTTDVTIGTNKRLYEIHVVSGGAQTVRARFYYPDDYLKQSEVERTKREKRKPVQQQVTPIVNTKYSVECDTAARFCPESVWDDGHKTYIKLPAGLEAIGIPAAYIMQNGEKQIVNYNTGSLPTYIVERIADKIILQSGGSKNQQQAVITREG